MSNSNLLLGIARRSIVPSRPVLLAGQFFDRVAESARGEIYATALALETDEASLLWVACDLVSVQGGTIEELRRRLAVKLPGFDPSMLVVSATHTHTAPACAREDLLSAMYTPFFGEAAFSLPEGCLDPDEYTSFFLSQAEEAAVEAWNRRESGGVSVRSDYAAIGFNRRTMYNDNRIAMYGSSFTPEFVRMEGPTDPRLELLYFWDPQERLIGILINVCCPSQVELFSSHISADYWHFVRERIEASYPGVIVVPVCGSAGDQTPVDLIRISKDNGKELKEWTAQIAPVKRNLNEEDLLAGIAARISEAVNRQYEPARSGIDFQPVFRHVVRRFEMPWQSVTPEEEKAAQREIDACDGLFSREHPLAPEDLVRLFDAVGTLLRAEEQERSPFYEAELHALRLGEAAIATSPFELYTEYGLRIKAQSSAASTILSQLTQGAGRYLPTPGALSSGGYGGVTACMTASPDGGDRLAAESVEMINHLF